MWYCCPRTSATTTTSVSGAPIQSGIPKRIAKPRAAPRNSASSVATQAMTIVTPKSADEGAREALAHVRGQRSPADDPQPAERCCRKISISVLSEITHSSL